MNGASLKKGVAVAIAACLSAAMAIGGPGALKPTAAWADSSVAAAGEAQQGYKLYPTPQSIAYADGSQVLRGAATTVIGSSIDTETVGRLQEALKLQGITATRAQDIPQSGTVFLMGVHGAQGDVADVYLNEHANALGVDADTLFSKTDAYVLASVPGGEGKPDVVLIVGKDTDAAFYGATTLYQIFQQMGDASLRGFVIKDYADVKSRGFIEGYYGNPWSVEDRVNLMKWGGYYKLNAYVYAPKDDPKHNAKWQELYTDEELQNITKEAVAGNESKCRFVYALHPFMSNPITSANYDTTVAKLKAKFLQVIDKAGVRQIAILADDAADQGQALYTKLLEDMTGWLHGLQAEKNADGTAKYAGLKDTIVFCPPNYMSWGEAWYKNLPSTVQVVNTGGEVWGTVNNNFTSNFTKTSGVSPFMWINWPCSDNTKSGLIMGGHDSFLGKDVKPGNIQGLVLNPMQQSEPSKQAIFMAADFSWHLWTANTDTNTMWNDSFSYVDHNSPVATKGSDALRELSKHMMESARKSGDQGESAEIKDTLLSLQSKLNNDSVTAQDYDTIAGIFSNLAQAAKTYRANAGNKDMLNQIVYWIDTWDDVTEAMQHFVDAGKAALEGNVSELVSNYSQGQEAYRRSQTHGFHYVDHTEYAKVGIAYITPTIAALDSYLSAAVQNAVDPDAITRTFITSRTDTPVGSTTQVFDGNTSTAASYRDPAAIAKGTTIGVKYSKPIDVNDVSFTMGSGKNHIYHAQLQVSYDAKCADWQDVSGATFNQEYSNALVTYSKDGLGLKNVYGVRLMATQDNGIDAYLDVNEIVVNKTDDTTPGNDAAVSLQLEGMTAGSGTWAQEHALDGDASTVAAFWATAQKDQLKAGNAVDFVFSKPVTLTGVSVTRDAGATNDFPSSGVYEYRAADSDEWKQFGTVSNDTTQTVTFSDGPQTVSAVRLRVTADKAVWMRIAEFTPQYAATGNEEAPVASDGVDTGDIQVLHKDGEASIASGSVTLKPGQYVGIDLGSIRTGVTVDLGSTVLHGAQLVTSTNKLGWDTLNTSKAAKAASTSREVGVNARYVAVRNAGQADAAVSLKNLVVQYTTIKNPSVLSSTIGSASNPDRMIDQDLSTAGGYNSYPKKDDTIVFDLGQERTITSLKYEIAETSKDFIRNAVVEVADTPDAETWTPLLKINDAAVDNAYNEDTAKQAAWLTHDSANPGNMYTANPKDSTTSGNTNDPNGTEPLNAKGRYLRVRFTAPYAYRWVAGDFIINNGAYVSNYDGGAFVQSGNGEADNMSPANLLDRDLSTVWAPRDDEGTLQYNVDTPMDADGKGYQGIRLVSQGTPSNATVTAELYTDDTFNETTKVTLGTLSQPVTDFRFAAAVKKARAAGESATGIVKDITVQWEGGAKPVLSEIYLLSSAPTADADVVAALQQAIKDAQGKSEEVSTWTADTKDAYDSALAAAQAIAEQSVQGTLTDDVIKAATSALNSAVQGGVVRYTGKELSQLVEQAVSNEDGRYSAQSFNDYADALNDAQVALNDAQNLSAEQGETLAEALKNAKAALTFNEVTYQRASAAVQDAQQFAEADYTSASYALFKQAVESLSQAVEAAKDDAAKRDPKLFDVDAVYTAQQALVDVTLLKQERAAFELTNADDYKAGYAAYKDAYDNSTTLLDNGTVKQIADAVKALQEARQALVIDDAIVGVAAQALQHEDQYTEASFAALKSAYQDATATNNATLEQITALKNAYQSLVDISALRAKVNAITSAALRAEDYTASSYRALSDALNAVPEQYRNGTNNSVASLLVTLEQARQGLVNVTVLTDAIKAAQGLNSKDYTASSWRMLQGVLASVQPLLDNASAQSIAEAAAQVRGAIADLVKVQQNHDATQNHQSGTSQKMPDSGAVVMSIAVIVMVCMVLAVVMLAVRRMRR